MVQYMYECRKYGVPPAGNAHFAWVQHFIHHLVPTGIAGFVLANGSMSSPPILEFVIPLVLGEEP